VYQQDRAYNDHSNQTAATKGRRKCQGRKRRAPSYGPFVNRFALNLAHHEIMLKQVTMYL